MLNVIVTERARTTAFVTLAKVKLALGIQNNDSDERLNELIEDVSDAVTQYCGRKFARETVTEHLEGHGHVTLSLARTPIQSVAEVRHITAAVSASGYSVSDPEAGFLYREDTWDSTQPTRTWIETDPINQPGSQDWHVDYIGGYLMPNDDFTSSAIVASGVENSFNISGDTFPMLVSGERVIIAGFANDDNNGTFTVLSRTASKLIVDTDLVTEVPSGVIAVLTNIPGNGFLPRDLQRIIMSEIRDQYKSEQRDSTIKSESIGDWSASYGGPSSSEGSSSFSGLMSNTEKSLTRWIRVM